VPALTLFHVATQAIGTKAEKRDVDAAIEDLKTQLQKVYPVHPAAAPFTSALWVAAASGARSCGQKWQLSLQAGYSESNSVFKFLPGNAALYFWWMAYDPRRGPGSLWEGGPQGGGCQVPRRVSIRRGHQLGNCLLEPETVREEKRALIGKR
jgi:hypothetical protein